MGLGVGHIHICRICRYWQATAVINQGYCTRKMQFTSAFHVCIF